MDVFLVYKGCNRRRMDGQRLLDFFRANGHRVVDKIEDADYVLFDTCSFKEEMDAENIAFLNEQIKPKLKPGAELVVCGCMPAINKDLLSQNFNGASFTPRTLHKINDFVKAETLVEGVPIPTGEGVPDGSFDCGAKFFRNFENNVCRIRVAEGCLGDCTYCAIRRATGVLKSTPLPDVIRQFKDGLNKGFKKFCLDSQDTAAYGRDIGSSITELLRAILQIDSPFMIGLYDLNPHWVEKSYDELLEIFKDSRIKEVIIPFQSGNPRILGLMKRSYDIQRFCAFLKDLRSSRPDLIFGTSVIAGFPSETMQEFEETMGVLRLFDWAHVHSYSDRPGTVSSRMKEKVPLDAKSKRVMRARLLVDGVNLEGFYDVEPSGYRWMRRRGVYDVPIEMVASHTLKIPVLPIISYAEGQNVRVFFQEIDPRDETTEASSPTPIQEYSLKDLAPDKEIILCGTIPKLNGHVSDAILRLIFETDRWSVPSEHGGEDSRELGLYIGKISL